MMVEKIRHLKRQKNAVILAHYYTPEEVRCVADFVGDSLALSVEAAKTTADIILFAGVYFMAETAKILSPDKKVLIPDLESECSLAASCPVGEFAAFKAAHPDSVVVSYVNTTAEIKALTDICCTSSNALDVINSIPACRPIIFAPDRNLGAYLQKQTGRVNMIVWDGACHVHEKFSIESILNIRTTHPDALVLAHPECREEVLAAADFIGSTSAILAFTGTSCADTFIVVTEPGILYEMRKKYPGKIFISPPPSGSAHGCNECEYMKMVTLPKILNTLSCERPEVTVPEHTLVAAEKSIRRMLELKC